MPLLPRFGVIPTPFRLTFPLREAFANRSWEDTRQSATKRAAQGERVVLVGEPGTGKTLLLQVLDRNLRAQGFDVRQFGPGDTLAAQPATEILLIDEGDLLEAEELERIWQLPNPIIMTGLPGLQERVPPCTRPVHAESLERLGPEDIARFVRARLTASETARPPFAPEAILALMRHSAGLFRLVTILAGAALFLAEQRGSSEVMAADVDEAALLRAGAFEEPEADTLPAAASDPSERPSAELELVAAEKWRSPRPTLAALGWTGWAGASLAVVMVAIVAAHALVQYPLLPMDAADPPPLIAASVLPQLALQPKVAAISPPPPPVPASLPPVMASLPSPPEPTAFANPQPIAAPSNPQRLASRPTARTQTVLVFKGPIMNDTMGQAGELSLKMVSNPAGGPVNAFFQASHGLIGAGELDGAIEPGGKIRLAGRLMMGRNSFDCQLDATLEGDHLVGRATFVHLTNGAPAHSRFALSRL